MTPLWTKFTLPLAFIILVLLFNMPLSHWQFVCSLFLPLYLLHQFEAHYKNRFKDFMNTTLFKSPKKSDCPLTDKDIFLINVFYCWIIFTITWLIGLLDSDILVLIPIISVVHSLIYLVVFLKSKKKYLPGFITACVMIALFVYVAILILFKMHIPTGYLFLSVIIAVMIPLATIAPLNRETGLGVFTDKKNTPENLSTATAPLQTEESQSEVKESEEKKPSSAKAKSAKKKTS